MWKEVIRLSDQNIVKRSLKQPQDQPKYVASPGFQKSVLYQNPHVEFRESIGNRGGGRGYFAVKDIQPGDLILAEISCAEIPDFPPNRDPAERCILQLTSGNVDLKEAQQVLSDLALLHPQSLEKDVEPDRLKTLRSSYAPLLKEMSELPIARALNLHIESVLLRVICALHFNGFVTGVYLHLAMVNHSCVPNCVKWGARDGLEHSEVRATRFIRAGEEITFSYLVPPLRSKKARQRALKGQFQFDCTCDLCLMKNGCSPKLEEGDEESFDKLEQLLESIEENNKVAIDPKGTLQLVLKARNETKAKGAGPRSLALAHADIVAVEACLALMEDGSMVSRKEEQNQNLVLTLLSKSFSIRKTQILHFSAGPPSDREEDIERVSREETRAEAEPTLQHIASGIGYFASFGKKGEQFLTSFRDDETGKNYFGDLRDAKACQIACDRASRCIADLYEDFKL